MMFRLVILLVVALVIPVASWVPSSSVERAVPTKIYSFTALKSTKSEIVREVTGESSKAVRESSQQEASPVLDVFKNCAPKVASIFVATLATHVLNNNVGMGPILASSWVGVASTLVLPEALALAAFCGSFAGMASTAVAPGLLGGGLLGLTCALAMQLFDSKKWLVGSGGRLGFIAQCACTTYFILMSLFKVSQAPAALMDANIVRGLSSTFAQLPSIAVYTVFGAVFVRAWKEAFAELDMNNSLSKRIGNSVSAVSIAGLLGAYLLPNAAGPVFCGSFVAMSAPDKLPTLSSLILASILAGVSQLALSGFLMGGWGGKLGTAALMGVVSFRTLSQLFTSSGKD